MTIKSLFILLVFLSTAGASWSQQLTPGQQAELKRLSEEAQAAFRKALDPDNITRLFDEQIQEARKSGATPAQIRELEQAKVDALQQFRTNQKEGAQQTETIASPNPSKKAADPNKALLTTLKNRPSQPDSGIAPVMYDPLPGRYSLIPMAFRVYADRKLTPGQFVAFMQKRFQVILRETGQFGAGRGQSRRYEQLHEGHPIRLSHYSITLDTNGYVIRANGDLFTITRVANPPRQASELLLALRQATQLPTLTLHNQISSETPLPYAQPLPMAWVHPNLDPANRAPVLAQPFTVVTPTQHRRWYLDAQTGALVATENRRPACAPQPGPYKTVVQTFHHQKRNVGVVAGLYAGKSVIRLADSTETPAIVIIKPHYHVVPEFTTDTLLNDAALRNRGDFDALYGFRQSARFFKNLGHHSFDNQGSSVHAESYLEENACWSPDSRKFYFGLVNKTPFADLNTIGHEFTHAVNEYTCGLIYQGESGALNESIADIFGTCIEHQAVGGNWLLAEAVVPGGTRDMANPTAKGDPDTYLESPWGSTSTTYDEGNVHKNSGVGNKWFYLLIKGGKGQNGLKHPYDVFPTMPYNTLARIVLTTLPRLSPRSGYEDLCRETIATAGQLFGECNGVTEAVKRAWYAVGVLEDAPVPCKPGWTMDMVMKNEGQKMVINLYFKGDSAVSVYRSHDGFVKTFSRRSSPTITAVVKNEDGIHTRTFPKDWTNFLERTMDQTLPEQDALMAEALQEARAELANPNTSPERQAELRKTIHMTEDFIRQGQQGRADMKKQLAEIREGSQAKSEMAFWGSRQARREFDKKYIKATTTYQGTYLARKYVLDGSAAGMYWWTTAQIPLSFSDLTLMLPAAPTLQMRSGLDHWIRGFPLQFHDIFQIQNIRESAPANFDTLFSTAPVF
ncbi:Zn-dependent metalloprotease [Spirosoma lacussanchae]|uniref:M4 family metallopeptidase n=1 Tax=Spirosoma lacussanchae TaxID=1884249 RepID=UPI00110971D9|nr:M4 family metallopeptidase [Spirosoma lacussanchae]